MKILTDIILGGNKSFILKIIPCLFSMPIVFNDKLIAPKFWHLKWTWTYSPLVIVEVIITSKNMSLTQVTICRHPETPKMLLSVRCQWVSGSHNITFLNNIWRSGQKQASQWTRCLYAGSWTTAYLHQRVCVNCLQEACTSSHYL